MSYRFAVVVLGATFLMLYGLSNASAQEVRGHYVVDIPSGASQAGSEHYFPAHIAVPVGTTIAWFNDDPNQQHTVTSGTSDSAGSGDDFDSGIISEGAFFQHTFDQAGEFDYYCTIHPGMTGSVSVNSAVLEGENFNVGLGTGPTFDFNAHERSLLRFEPVGIEIPEDEPVTYELTIMKDDQEVFSEEFRTLGGILYVDLVPTNGTTQVTGPDISDPIIGAYHIEGSFLQDNAEYTIRPEITLLFDQPPAEEITDEFTMQIVPEFPVGIMLPIAAAIGASIFAGRKLYRRS
jgi:plastocyanin